MKNLEYIPDFFDYRDDVLLKRFPDERIREHPFYKNLIDYVLLNRSPIFYDISEPREHFSFSGAYHFQTIRSYDDVYNPETRRSIFYLHDFTHSLFPLPQNAREVSLEEFTKQFIYQERLASTETEVMLYYRIPGIRETVFTDEKIYYDVMLERGMPEPSPSEFLEHRNRLVEDPEYGRKHLSAEEDQGILRFFQIWNTLTPKWCAERWETLLTRDIPEYDWERFDVETYIPAIENFRLPEKEECQRRYERNLMRNLNMAAAILREPWEITEAKDIEARLMSLEDKAFFPEDKRKKTVL